GGRSTFGLYAFGQKQAANCVLCPRTTELVEAIPGLSMAGYSGEVEVSDAHVALKEGGFFGELALLTGAPRNATVIAREKVEVLTLAEEHFDEALKRSKTLDEQLRFALYGRT